MDEKERDKQNGKDMDEKEGDKQNGKWIWMKRKEIHRMENGYG